MTRIRAVRRRYWLEVALAVVTATLAVLTAIWPDWVEIVFGYDPDQHSGLLEVGTLIAACAALAGVLLARFEWRRSVGIPPSESVVGEG